MLAAPLALHLTRRPLCFAWLLDVSRGVSGALSTRASLPVAGRVRAVPPRDQCRAGALPARYHPPAVLPQRPWQPLHGRGLGQAAAVTGGHHVRPHGERKANPVLRAMASTCPVTFAADGGAASRRPAELAWWLAGRGRRQCRDSVLTGGTCIWNTEHRQRRNHVARTVVLQDEADDAVHGRQPGVCTNRTPPGGCRPAGWAARGRNRCQTVHGVCCVDD